MQKHLMDWVSSFLKQHSRTNKFNQHWVMIHPYPFYTRFNQPHRWVLQWSGMEKTALGYVIVPVFMATLVNPSASQRIPFIVAPMCVENLIYIRLMTLNRYHTVATIEYMVNYLEEFHCQMDVISRLCTSK
jgi:hypothetical protein